MAANARPCGPKVDWAGSTPRGGVNGSGERELRITVYTDYALRVLIYLGMRGERLATIRQIAEAYGISRNHLMKVVNGLQQHGCVETIRGRSGGLRLGQPPERIKLGDIVRYTEQDMALMECFTADNRCVITPHCDLRFMLDEALQAFLGVLDRYTLADLLSTRRGPGLRRTLSLSGVPVRIEAAPGDRPACGKPRRRAG
jgi:Rrf2 family transcriptional regulator, nitric oxide-sensitive transcriptional repressor